MNKFPRKAPEAISPSREQIDHSRWPGAVPREFSTALRSALNQIQEETPMKKFAPRPIMAVAALLVLCIVTFAASPRGTIGFHSSHVDDRIGNSMPPTSTAEPVSLAGLKFVGKNGKVSIIIKEARFDGKNLGITYTLQNTSDEPLYILSNLDKPFPENSPLEVNGATQFSYEQNLGFLDGECYSPGMANDRLYHYVQVKAAESATVKMSYYALSYGIMGEGSPDANGTHDEDYYQEIDDPTYGHKPSPAAQNVAQNLNLYNADKLDIEFTVPINTPQQSEAINLPVVTQNAEYPFRVTEARYSDGFADFTIDVFIKDAATKDLLSKECALNEEDPMDLTWIFPFAFYFYYDKGCVSFIEWLNTTCEISCEWIDLPDGTYAYREHIRCSHVAYLPKAITVAQVGLDQATGNSGVAFLDRAATIMFEQ